MREDPGPFVPEFRLKMPVAALTLPLPEGEGQNTALFSFDLDQISK
jgi:hypothetical protein